MSDLDPRALGATLKSARRSAGLTQLQLAKVARVHRVQIVRVEAGLVVPRLDEAVRLAAAVRIAVELLWNQEPSRTDLRGIAIELYNLGIHDLQVADPVVPGSLRRAEEIVVLAVSGDRPEPRVVEAIPFVLARGRLRASLVAGFANLHDRRARTRIAWLADVTLALNQVGSLPVGSQSAASLRKLIRQGRKPAEPDSLGHPSGERLPPIWRRWNITYAGALRDFQRRTSEVEAALQTLRGRGEGS